MADVEIDENLVMDLQNLISCIECHKDEENIEVTFETLKTIVNICAEEEIGKDAFRDVGGLDFLLQFIIDTDQLLILESCLKTLAFVIDKNVHSQMYMTQDKVFRILSAIIEKKTYPLGVLKNAIILLSTLLYQNRGAQDMIQENNCLLSLINLYKSFSPVNGHCINLLEASEHLELWLHINSALCFAVNNPLHEKNQSMCSELFPLSIRIVEVTFNPLIIKAASSFLSLSIANNEKNQDSFAEIDGFFMLKRSLSKNVEEIQSCIRDCNNVIKKDDLEILNALISIVSAAVSDHEKNASWCGKLGIVSLLTKLLVEVTFDSSSTKKILLVLNNCVDAHSENKLIILETPKLDIFLKRYLETNDSELYTAAKYLLQICLIDFTEENEQTEHFCSQSYDRLKGSYQHSCKKPDETDVPKQNSFQQSRNSNDLAKIFDAQNSSSFKGGIQQFNFMDFQTKDGQNMTCQNHQHSCECNKNTAFEKNSWSDSDSDSLGDASLHSAHHLFMLKMNRYIQNECSPKKAKLKNCCNKDNLSHMNAESKMNSFDIRGIEIDCLTTKETASKNALSKCHCGSRKSDKLLEKPTLREDKTRKGEVKKRNDPNSSPSSKMLVKSKKVSKSGSKISCDKRASSLKEDVCVDNAQNGFRGTSKEANNFAIQGIEIDCLMPQKMTPKNNLEKCHSDSRKSGDLAEKLQRDKNKKHDAKKRHGQNLPHSLELSADRSQELNSGTDLSCNKNQYLTNEISSPKRGDVQECSDLYKFKESGKKRRPTTKPYCFGPRDPSPHHHKDKKVHRSAKGSSRPSNTEGCMEVIVLPGAGCPEHKLTAQFELLRVCPLKTDERKIS